MQYSEATATIVASLNIRLRECASATAASALSRPPTAKGHAQALVALSPSQEGMVPNLKRSSMCSASVQRSFRRGLRRLDVDAEAASIWRPLLLSLLMQAATLSAKQ